MPDAEACATSVKVTLLCPGAQTQSFVVLTALPTKGQMPQPPGDHLGGAVGGAAVWAGRDNLFNSKLMFSFFPIFKRERWKHRFVGLLIYILIG